MDSKNTCANDCVLAEDAVNCTVVHTRYPLIDESLLYSVNCVFSSIDSWISVITMRNVRKQTYFSHLWIGTNKWRQRYGQRNGFLAPLGSHNFLDDNIYRFKYAANSCASIYEDCFSWLFYHLPVRQCDIYSWNCPWVVRRPPEFPDLNAVEIDWITSFRLFAPWILTLHSPAA